MADKKKYNPDDVERWVTVRGARIPIMKDGSFGVGTKDDDVDDEERAMDLVDSKDYIGDKEITRQVKDQLKDFGKASSVTVDSVEVSSWNGKSDKGYVKATYTLKGVEHGGRKTNQTFTDEFAVNVRKPQTVSKNAKYDTGRSKKKKPSSLEAFKENARQFESALNEATKQGALEVEFTDITGKTFKRWWNGGSWSDRKIV